MSSRPVIVFVHGAWYGAWCWDRVVGVLRANGWTTLSIDLPGRGSIGCDPSQVTLDSCAAHVRSAVEGLPEPVVLVAHSLGGMIATQVAEDRPSSVAAAIYVSAFLPQSGQAAIDVIRADEASEVRALRVLSPDGRSSTVLPHRIADVLCNGCDPVDVDLVRAKVVPESLAIARTPVYWTAGRFGRIPRFYIECTADRVISPAAQRAMARATPCVARARLPTGHAPFLSLPKELGATIGSMVRHALLLRPE